MSVLSALLLFAHVASAAGLIVGVLGRNIALGLARRARAMPGVDRWVGLAGRLERALVIPGSNVVFVSGLALAWLRGWPILGFLQGGRVSWVLASLLLYLATVPLVVWVFLPRGRVFEAALEAARAAGAPTPELAAAFRDRAVWLARGAEYILAAAIVYLMVAKPF